MDPQKPLDNSETRGYLSQENKRKFTITAGILGALFFLAQFIVPFVLMMVIMPFMTFSVSRLRMADPHRGTYFDGAIWYVEKGMREAGGFKKPFILKKIELDDMEVPKNVEKLTIEEAWLLGGEDRLWIISSSTIGWYDKDGLILSDGMPIGDICRPFLYEGRPAVMRYRPEGLSFLVLKDKQWQKKCPIELNTKERVHDLHKNLQVLAEKDLLHFFMLHGNTLYYNTAQFNDNPQVRGEWQIVSPCSYGWQATWIDNKPALFYSPPRDVKNSVVGLRLSENQWEQFFSYDIPMVNRTGIYPLTQSDKFFIFFQSFPGSTQILEVEGTSVTDTIHYGSDLPFPRSVILLMFIPHGMTMLMPLILSIILSSLMRKHRKCVHEVDGSSMPFASLTRRAFAQLIDAACLGVPISLVFFLFLLRPFFNMDETQLEDGLFPLFFFGMMFGTLVWIAVCLLLFSLLEGRWGVTPGKWLLRIRVIGADLQHCGFGRALIRNLLKFVDGFFNFMVGVMVAALTENWQRVGDMAARTVVIHIKKKDNQIQEGSM